MAERKQTQYVSDNAQLVSEWNYSKNTELQINETPARSKKTAWWICEKGHEWEAIIANRARGSKCPICTNRKVLKGFNDLQTLFPAVAMEWHYEKNESIAPDQIVSGSNKKVWWKCESGHEWETTIASRTVLHTGCPVCARTQPIKEFVDLASSRPELAQEWHYEKNAPLTPSHISAGSGKNVWWKCSLGHEWQATVNHRSYGIGCPVCAGKKALAGFNDLATIAPQLAKEWHPTKNGELLPSQVTKAYSVPVWWHCDKGHEWQAAVGLRIGNKSSCPYCTGKRVIEGETDLLTLNPELAKEWNHQKNESLLPNMVAAYSNQRVWWQCDKGHEWQAAISSRSQGRGCPYCSNQKVLVGYNDLQTMHPYIAQEWNYAKNQGLSPTDVVSGSGKSVWWVCSEGHEWKAAIYHRTSTQGKCPFCFGKKPFKKIHYN